MHNHLVLKIDEEIVDIQQSSSININFQNPLFNKVETFSFPFEIPIKGNRKVFGNIEDPNGEIQSVDIDDKTTSVIVDGIPVASGKVLTEDNYSIENSISISVNSARKSFSDLISNLKCSDIDIPERIVVGEKIGKIKVSGSVNVKEEIYNLVVRRQYEYGGVMEYDTDWEKIAETSTRKEIEIYMDTPGLGFSYPALCVRNDKGIAETSYIKEYLSPIKKQIKVPKIYTSFINTSIPFDNDHPYCNARICYKHYGAEKEKDSDKYKTTSEITKDKSNINEAKWPYWVLDANRPMSGICFYVLYFLRCLFTHLGIAYNDDELYAIEDMRRLCFFTTKCAFYEETSQKDFFKGYGNNFEEHINGWLESRGCGSSVKLELSSTKTYNTTEGERADGDHESGVMISGTQTVSWMDTSIGNLWCSADLNNMIATKDNFPNESVQSVIESLENSFGVRFMFDVNGTSCKAILIRDVFRNSKTTIDFLGDVISVHKVMNKTTGVRVCYSSESDIKEQKENIRKGVRKYDTDYDYIDYPPENQNTGIVVGKPQTITNKRYKDFFKNLSSSDMNCYIDKKTGNAYRVKISEDAKTAKEWNPVLFEVGGYKGVEIGDCSEQNKDYIIELVSQFVPIVLNDVNYQEELNQDNPVPCFAAYVDEDMEHEFVESYLESVSEFEYGKVTLKVTLSGIESYDPTKTEDGNSPLQNIDWGLSLAMMRGGGSSSYFMNYDMGYDGFGNDKWKMMAGKDYQMFNDTMTHFAQKFDYNGEDTGDGGGERFSLKMRAYKQPDWSEYPLFDGSVNDKNRGLFDTFMSEYAHFLLNMKPLRIKTFCTAAQLFNIQNNWSNRFNIYGYIGYINKYSCNISNEKGIGEVIIDFYSI